SETIIVRGGEHPGFTRLVFQVDSRRGWSLTPVAEGWDLRLGVEAAHFDVTQAWRLITRQRLIDLRALDGGVLRLVSDCVCHIRRWQCNGRPVIDIYDGDPRIGRPDIARHPNSVTKPQDFEN